MPRLYFLFALAALASLAMADDVVRGSQKDYANYRMNECEPLDDPNKCTFWLNRPTWKSHLDPGNLTSFFGSNLRVYDSKCGDPIAQLDQFYLKQLSYHNGGEAWGEVDMSAAGLKEGPVHVVIGPGWPTWPDNPRGNVQYAGRQVEFVGNHLCSWCTNTFYNMDGHCCRTIFDCSPK